VRLTMDDRDFAAWLDDFLREKKIDSDEILEVPGPLGLNLIPVETLVAAMRGAPTEEQAAIRRLFTRIDFVNAEVRPALVHLAQAIAL